MNPSQARQLAAPQPQPPEPRLTVIVVNYESWSDVARLLECLTPQPAFRSGACQVVVVDNASRGPVPETIALSLSRFGLGLQVIQRPDNGGFAAGVNTGWRAAGGRWLLVLNPDVEVAGDFLRQALARLDHYEADADGPPGIVGFGLRNPDGSPQGSVGAFPSLARSIWEQFLPRSRRKYQPGWRIRPGPVDWVTGACMLVSTPMIEALGGMDEDFFLYHEEVAFSRVAQNHGWRVQYDPSVTVIHRHPLQNRPISPKMRIITRHSKLLYFRKHLPYWQFWSLSAIVAAEAAIQWGWAGLRRRRDEARSWRTIAEVARRLRRGVPPRGTDVRAMAEAATSPGSERGRKSEGTSRLASASASAGGRSSPLGMDAEKGAPSRRRPFRASKGWNRLTTWQHAARMGLLMAATAALLGWELRHSEASFADGLRYVHRAEQIERHGWAKGVLEGIDHPLHPLGIVAAHRVLGGIGPASWQRAARRWGFVCVVLLIVPTYLLALELFGEPAAWLACVLVALNPILGYVVVNVLSESTFLLWWTFGLWGSVRFLREGRFLWLPLAIGFGGLAYLTRPEGMLLPAAVVLALLLLPMLRATRINWPRWWRALAFLAGGLVLVASLYVAVKGGLGTKPGVARVLGLAPRSDPMGLERERPLPAGQSAWETNRVATVRMFKVFRAAVTPPMFLFGLFGLGLAAWQRTRVRAWLFLAIVLAASAVGLARLHATGGYCTVRHGLVPGLILTMAAAHGLAWSMSKVAIPGRWLGLAAERLRPGPAVWAALLALLVVLPNVRALGPSNAGPFAAYQSTGQWIAEQNGASGRVLDLTDWSLFFSQRTGYPFATIYEAAAHPEIRWIVVRKPHVQGHWNYSRVIRDLIGDREPVALIPPNPGHGQVQVRVYDREAPTTRTATSPAEPRHKTDIRRR